METKTLFKPSLLRAALLIGVGLMAAVDEIVFHKVLRLHQVRYGVGLVALRRGLERSGQPAALGGHWPVATGLPNHFPHPNPR